MKHLCYFIFMLHTLSSSLAQNIPYPIDSMPDTLMEKYETVTEQILLTESATRYEIVPAQFKYVEEQILVKQAYSGYRTPVYQTIEEKILVKEGYTQMQNLPPVYEQLEETVVVRPAIIVHIKRKKPTGTFSSACYNPKYSGLDTCNWRRDTLPVQYQTILKRRQKQPEKVKEIAVPPEFQTLQKQLIDEQATQKQALGKEQIEIEAEYQTIVKEILVSPAQINEVEIPADYSTVTSKKLVNPGGFIEGIYNQVPHKPFLRTPPPNTGRWIKSREGVNALSQNPEDALAWKWIPNNQDSGEPPNTEQYDEIIENKLLKTTEKPLSTFSIDVDKASYSNVRRFINNGQLPPKNAVRIEEFINYFDYDYAQPSNKHPFAIHTEIGKCPWNENNYLLHIGLQGKDLALEEIPPNNLVFLLDVSGSMNSPNKLPLLKESLKMVARQMRPQDKVSVVVYAGAAGLVLPPTSGTDKLEVFKALDNLRAGGSTAGGAGIELAYKMAQENFIQDGNNRVILATDGDFNVGISSDEGLVQLIEQKRQTGIYLTVLGFGQGNYQEAKMEKLADKGNGNFAYIDNIMEAKKTLVNELSGTLYTIAKDVKIQVEFNPTKVASYRLIGYENRLLAAQDFQDDTKDAGEIGAGHTVTALYEITPLEGKPQKKDLKINLSQFAEAKRKPSNFKQNEWVNIHFRYKPPTWDSSRLLTHTFDTSQITQPSNNFTFSAAVAAFGMLLRDSPYKGKASFSMVESFGKKAQGEDKERYRKEFLDLVAKAAKIMR